MDNHHRADSTDEFTHMEAAACAEVGQSKVYCGIMRDTGESGRVCSRGEDMNDCDFLKEKINLTAVVLS